MSNPVDIFDVSAQLCVITGTSSGLGLYAAQQLAKRGATVIGIARHVAANPEPVSGFTQMAADVTDFDAMGSVVEKIEREFGPITSFINNAGIADHGKPGVTNPETFRALLETNTIAPAVLTDMVAQTMAKNGVAGSIVNVSSALAHKGMARLASYGASKAALEAMTRQQAVNWGKSGIRINAFAPGWFFSDMTNQSLNQGFAAVLSGMTPLRRIGTVEDMLGALLFLVSNASQFVTGTTICADGGYSIN